MDDYIMMKLNYLSSFNNVNILIIVFTSLYPPTITIPRE